MKIYLFLPDFRGLVKDLSIVPEGVGYNHPVFYYETKEIIYFYKPVGSIIYCLEISKNEISPKELKQEFKAIEITKEIMPSLSFTAQIREG